MIDSPYKGPVDWRGLPINRPYPWERDVTIGIAALCCDGEQQKIVLCVDRRLSSALGTTDTFLKNRTIANGWRVLVSGTETHILRLQSHFAGSFRHHFDGTFATIDGAIKAALYSRKKELADEYTRTHFAMSHDEFLSHGKEKLPADIFYSAVRKIEATDLGAEFIVVGFLQGVPEVYHCDSSGTAYPVSAFSVVGEGGYLASSALMRRQQNEIRSLEITLYNVYEAKRYSQAVGSVGPGTTMTVMSPDGTHRMIGAALEHRLDAFYREFGPKDLPGDFELAPPLYHDEERPLIEQYQGELTQRGSDGTST